MALHLKQRPARARRVFDFQEKQSPRVLNAELVIVVGKLQTGVSPFPAKPHVLGAEQSPHVHADFVPGSVGDEFCK